MDTKAKLVYEEKRRFVAGIDIASRANHFVCGPRNDVGEREIVSFGTTTPELYKMLHWLQERKVESVVIESTGVYWRAPLELLEKNGIEVVLVDPRKVKMIPKKKSDVKDCDWLQYLHSCDMLEGAFRPQEAIVAVRSILREQNNLIKMRAQVILQMQKSLDQMNICIHKAVSDIDGVTGKAIIKAIINGERNPHILASLRDKRCKKSIKEIAEHLTGTWREEHLFILEEAFNTMCFLDDRIANYDKKVEKLFATLAENNDNDDTPLPPSLSEPKKTARERQNLDSKIDLFKIMGFDLTSVPGIGYDLAKIIVSELGPCFYRFKNEKAFVSYIGLAPNVGKSAGRNVRQKKYVNTSRVGHYLRIAATSVGRTATALGEYFRSIQRRKDYKTAVKTLARKLAHLIFRGVRFGKEFVDSGIEAYENMQREKSVKWTKKLIMKYNINSLELGLG